MYLHGIFLVTLGGEQDDVVGAFKVVERMIGSDLLKRYTRLTDGLSLSRVVPTRHAVSCRQEFHLGNESPAFTFAFEHLAAFLEVSIKLWQFLPEIVQASIEILVRHEEMFLHIFLFHLIASLSREDDQLPDDVLTTKVNARVRFRISLFLCPSDGFRERYIGTNLVEDEVERSRQHRLYLQDLVTRVAQVVDGADDRQTSSHVGFKPEEDSSA